MKKVFILITFLVALSCTDSELIENWKNPEIESFETQKVLVLALSNDESNRVIFEERLAKDLNDKDVQAVTGDSFFNQHFFTRPSTEEDLGKMEELLLQNGFDAILVTKVVGATNKVSLAQGYRNFNKNYATFWDFYYANHSPKYNDYTDESYVVYRAQSVLYCICSDIERQTIWRASIDVAKLDSEKKAIKDYIKMMLWTLEEQNLLLPRK